MLLRLLLLAPLSSILACRAVLPTPGTSLADSDLLAWVLPTVAFDHGCPEERIRFIRSSSHNLDAMPTLDLDVCGSVRRYKAMGGHGPYLDVTSLYPPSSLPAPLPE